MEYPVELSILTCHRKELGRVQCHDRRVGSNKDCRAPMFAEAHNAPPAEGVCFVPQYPDHEWRVEWLQRDCHTGQTPHNSRLGGRDTASEPCGAERQPW